MRLRQREREREEGILTKRKNEQDAKRWRNTERNKQRYKQGYVRDREQ